MILKSEKISFFLKHSIEIMKKYIFVSTYLFDYRWLEIINDYIRSIIYDLSTKA